jgi:hypothetical protein
MLNKPTTDWNKSKRNSHGMNKLKKIQDVLKKKTLQFKNKSNKIELLLNLKLEKLREQRET